MVFHFSFWNWKTIGRLGSRIDILFKYFCCIICIIYWIKQIDNMTSLMHVLKKLQYLKTWKAKYILKTFTFKLKLSPKGNKVMFKIGGNIRFKSITEKPLPVLFDLKYVLCINKGFSSFNWRDIKYLKVQLS